MGGGPPHAGGATYSRRSVGRVRFASWMSAFRHRVRSCQGPCLWRSARPSARIRLYQRTRTLSGWPQLACRLSAPLLTESGPPVAALTRLLIDPCRPGGGHWLSADLVVDPMTHSQAAARMAFPVGVVPPHPAMHAPPRQSHEGTTTSSMARNISSSSLHCCASSIHQEEC